jgi:pyruvate/2-oxoglutarate dehydrogenase complex dihydrolipoamide dehydrogenase (E3) component
MKPEDSYEAIVIGGGKGGKTLAVDLGRSGIRTALIERDPAMVGGTCINVACIPTKAFIASARLAAAARLGSAYGVKTGDVAVDWRAVRQRVEGVVAGMRAMNLKNFTSAPALDFILGTASFLSPHVVEVHALDGGIRRLTAPKIFINTGTRPARPSLPGLDRIGPRALTSNTIQQLAELPDHLLILGGSYVALEFAQMFRRFGSRVTVVERGAQLLAREDEDVAGEITTLLRAEGVDVLTDTVVEGVGASPGGVELAVRSKGRPLRLTGSHVLVALGREPVSENLNLASAGIATDPRGFITVNERLETTAPGIWAIGDVSGGPQFTHASLDDYRILKTNVFGAGGRTRHDRLMPFALFIEPELARVGLTEKEARAQGRALRVAKIPASAIPRARTSGRTEGFLKAIVDEKTSRILGCTILAAEAGETISTVQMAMVAGLPYPALRDAVFTHPTMTEGLNALFAALPPGD